MNRSIVWLASWVVVAGALAACQNPVRSGPPAATVGASGALAGSYDNHAQVLQAGDSALPRVRIDVTPMPAKDWTRWQITYDAASRLQATWMLHSESDSSGKRQWIPYHRVASAADSSGTDTFDPRQWTPLTACALRVGPTGSTVQAGVDVARCTALAPGIGASAALMPLQIEHTGDWLRVRLYADQARGATARAEARRVRWFGGWAAINGAGEQATAENRDWHMNRDLRVGSEGGSAALKWRDGQSAGYSLRLERLTIADSGMEILKLSIIEDASGRALAYAWSDPGSTRIGFNLGWIQIGLQQQP